MKHILMMLFVAALAVRASAQEMAGTVSDQTSGVLPGATVTLKNTSTAATRTVVTNDAGVYSASLLPVGTYNLTFEAKGFQPVSVTGVPLHVNDRLQIDRTLSAVAMSTEVVSVWSGPIFPTPSVGAQPPGQAGKPNDPDKVVKGSGTLPPDWKARLDQPTAKMDGVAFENTGTGFHITTGPAGIYYTPQAPTGHYKMQATFTQIKPSAHPEAYGLFIGGSDLQGDNQKYTYFVIRQDGKFLIKRRAGAETPTVLNWTDSPAIKKADASGKMTNALTVEVGQDKVRFLVNNTEVASQPVGQLDTKGLAGLRINHNLDVMVEALMVSADAGAIGPKD